MDEIFKSRLNEIQRKLQQILSLFLSTVLRNENDVFGFPVWAPERGQNAGITIGAARECRNSWKLVQLWSSKGGCGIIKEKKKRNVFWFLPLLESVVQKCGVARTNPRVSFLEINFGGFFPGLKHGEYEAAGEFVG